MTHWIRASRPKTLPAAAVPVLVGGSLAGADGRFALEPWSLCLAFALLIQVGTNFANDYYDFLKGADDHRRIGPARAVASGWIKPKAMRNGMWLAFGLAFLAGSLLVPHGGWGLVVVGLLSIASGIAYTGGPYPLGYHGWGDVFVFLFFGWVATGFTYYVQGGSFAFVLPGNAPFLWIWLAGMVPGALSTNLLVVNNIRDAPLDREAGKRTLVVRFGRRFACLQYIGLNLVAIVVPMVFVVMGEVWSCLVVLPVIPLMIQASRRLLRANKPGDYETLLVTTAGILLLTGILFSGGLMFAR